MEKYITSNLKTELGYFTLKSIKKKITYFYPSNNKSEKINNNYLHINFLKTLNNYFLKESFSFRYQLKLVGTEFEKKVWHEISKIKYGQTVTYNDIAKKLSFVIGDDIESESDQLQLTTDDELHDEVMAYLRT